MLVGQEMKLRIAMIGAGAVATVHAANLSSAPDVELTAVYSPDITATSAFASQFRFRHLASSLQAACAGANVAIICSPPKHHFQQALVCLQNGLHTLIELPACECVAEAEALAQYAEQNGLRLGCAHTARYLRPYIQIGDYLHQGLLGAVRHVNYVRFPLLNPKAWIDHALAHHAAHILDLILDWFGAVEPIAATLHPNDVTTRTASLLGRLPNGGSAAVTVSYDSQLPANTLLVVGEKHTIESDGFSFVRSDNGGLHQSPQQPIYENAIRDQDRAFLAACRGVGDYINWQETIQLMRTVDRFRKLSRTQLNTGQDG